VFQERRLMLEFSVFSEPADSDLTVALPRGPVKDHRFAYVTVISGCTPQTEDMVLFQHPCLGYVLSILANTYAISSYNVDAPHNDHDRSTTSSDFVLMVEMEVDPDEDDADAHLPTVLSTWLDKAGVIVMYLPPSKNRAFELANLNKFRALDLDIYDRIIVMDADILLFTNVDYMFHASLNGTIQTNAAMAGSASPSNGGFFLATPKRGDFARLLDIVRQARMNSTEFDRVRGWGHEISGNDGWKAWGKRASADRQQEWKFYAASSDQGLLYHWMRYVQMNYTQFLGDGFYENYHDVTDFESKPTTVHPVESANGGTRLLGLISVEPTSTLQGQFQDIFPATEKKPHLREAPWVDFCHFMGNSKPWRDAIVASKIASPKALLSDTRPARRSWSKKLWQAYVVKANATFDLRLPSMLNLTSPPNPHGSSPSLSGGLLNPDLPLPV